MTHLQQDIAASSKDIRLFFDNENQLKQVESIQALIADHQLPINLHPEFIQSKLTKKVIEQLRHSTDKHQKEIDSENKVILWLDNKDKLSLYCDGLSVTPEWDKLQKRIVSAGRKSELLLQAAKITADSTVVDATAGFGHDSLILASTGAQVIMLEQQPMIALLLLAEQQRMSVQPNWQKLMSRLNIINTDAISYFSSLVNNATRNKIDVVYLDPMFPMDSYQDHKTGKGAKVGKHMQALHQLAQPPTLEEEQQLLNSAQTIIAQNTKNQGRVIIKRPQQAPSLAQQSPDESWHNAALRFDGYFI